MHHHLAWYIVPIGTYIIQVWSIVYLTQAFQSLSQINEMLHTFFMFKPRLGAAGKQKHKIMFPLKNQLEAFINEKSLFQDNTDQDIEDGINKLTEEAARILYSEWKRGEINNGSVNQDTEDKMINDYCDTLNNFLREYNVNSASVKNNFKQKFTELKN